VECGELFISYHVCIKSDTWTVRNTQVILVMFVFSLACELPGSAFLWGRYHRLSVEGGRTLTLGVLDRPQLFPTCSVGGRPASISAVPGRCKAHGWYHSSHRSEQSMSWVGLSAVYAGPLHMATPTHGLPILPLVKGNPSFVQISPYHVFILFTRCIPTQFFQSFYYL